jgi:Mn2+/Fe2+ NRAMP family transporter
MTLKSRILNILFWSIISAAFIGPGTVTTAAKAGASYEFGLLWALVFSTVTCLILQEASARITILSGKNLGEAIANRYNGKKIRYFVLFLVVGAIIFGSAAYETGNLLGAMSGIVLIVNVPEAAVIIGLGSVAAIALFFPGIRLLARILGFVVVIMGISFLTTAIMISPPIPELLKGSIVPTIPTGSGLLILGLIGTTVVPYNLFLGSGVANKKMQIGEMRLGLAVAVILGGVISMAVLVTGTMVTGTFSYEALGEALSLKLGYWADVLLGVGLMAAGISSAITAPLASAITARSLFDKASVKEWKEKGVYYRLVWLLVLLAGIFFGLAGFKPIPAIITAQALNGFILPLISIFLLFVINDPGFMGRENLNGSINNLLMILVVWVTLVLGSVNLVKVIGNVAGLDLADEGKYLMVLTIAMGVVALTVYGFMLKKRKAVSGKR